MPLQRRHPAKTPARVAAMLLTAAIVPIVTRGSSEAPAWSGNLGIGAAVAPTYSGSPNQRVTPITLLSLTYRNPRMGTFQMGESGLSWLLPNTGGLRLGLTSSFDIRRRSHEEKDGPVTLGDDRLRGMGDVPTIFRAGPTIGYGPLTFTIGKAITHSTEGGLIADLGIAWEKALTPKWGISAGAAARWGDRDYLQTYYGVTPAQARASRFTQYTPEAGIVSAQVKVGARYQLSRHWLVQGGLAYQRLVDHAAESPLAERPGSLVTLLGAAWQF